MFAYIAPLSSTGTPLLLLPPWCHRRWRQSKPGFATRRPRPEPGGESEVARNEYNRKRCDQITASRAETSLEAISPTIPKGQHQICSRGRYAATGIAGLTHYGSHPGLRDRACSGVRGRRPTEATLKKKKVTRRGGGSMRGSPAKEGLGERYPSVFPSREPGTCVSAGGPGRAQVPGR
jgi:hypothetical protein